MVDFGNVHGISEEHPFSLVGQRVIVVNPVLETNVHIKEAIADSGFDLHWSHFHETPKESCTAVIDGDGVDAGKGFVHWIVFTETFFVSLDGAVE